jgi:hypothetical protein
VLARPDEYLVAARSRGRPVGLDMRNSVATQPIGVIISGADFKTEAAANFAGEGAGRVLGPPRDEDEMPKPLPYPAAPLASSFN